MKSIALLVAVLASWCAGFAAAQDAAEPVDVDTMVEKGLALLLTRQEGDGDAEWPYEGVYRVGGKIPIGYRVGGTAIVGLALIEAPGKERDKSRSKAIGRGVAFILEALKDERMGDGFIGGYDVRGWGHAYALTFFLRLKELDRVPSKLRTRVDRAIKSLIKLLQDSEIEGAGGWNYARGRGAADASVFMTAPTLQALFNARAAGYRVDPKVVDRALDAVDNARMDSGSYAYNRRRRDLGGLSDEKAAFMDKLPGAIARMAVAETTLMLAGRGDPKRLEASLSAFFEHQNELEVRRRKNGTHLKPYGVAPYYYMYGHYYAAQAIEFLDDAELRAEYRGKLRKILTDIREEDGGFNDRVFERSKAYGTALAVLALRMPQLSRTAEWKPGKTKRKL